MRAVRDGRLVRPSGAVPYRLAYDWMHGLARRRLGGEIPDTLVLLEHPPVYTAGRRTRPGDVLWTERQILEAGAELHHVDRGGNITFHGPGQLVGYPILDLGPRPDVLGYLRRLEDVLIGACAELGVELTRDREATGVWASDRKVGAIGVRVMRARVTLHGFALNCETEVAWFDAIVPCGLSGRGVTTLSALACRRVSVEEMAPRVVRHFESVFDVAMAPGNDLSPPTAVPEPEPLLTAPRHLDSMAQVSSR